MTFERRRPPLEMTTAHAQGISPEVGGALSVRNIAEGSGTDTAFAALHQLRPGHRALGPAPVGSCSNDAEDVHLDRSNGGSTC